MDWAPHMRRIIERLGEDVTYTPAVGSPATVRALYIAPFYRALDLVPSSQPRLALMAADIASLSTQDHVTVRGTAYRIAEIEPNAVSGVTVCPLEEV